MKNLTFTEWRKEFLPECEHENMTFAYKEDKFERRYFYEQCEKCGFHKFINNRFKQPIPYEINKKLDEKKSDEYQKNINLQWNEYRKSLQDDWFKSYAEYLNSNAWKEKRNLVLKRDHNTCQGCGNKASQVHHLDYSNVRDELLFQLVAVCDICHKKIHKENVND